MKKYWIDTLKDMMNTWEPGTIGVGRTHFGKKSPKSKRGNLKG